MVAPYIVESASGVRLRLADNREVIDGMSSWWAAIHGYRHPALDAAARGQLDRMSHVMFGGLTHEPATRLAKTLVDITPPGLEHVFFADSGSVAVEVAVKMSLQYWQSVGRPAKTRLMTVRGGYHGDTFAAMSVCDPVDGMHHLFAEVLPKQLFADRPPLGFSAPVDDSYVAQLRDLVALHADELAAVIVEPVVQGAGGMRFYNPHYVRVLRDSCTENGVLFVLDEIATGFGRSGPLFGCEHADVVPDVLCVGKALSGGYVSLAATVCTAEVAHAISAGPGRAFMHGPTYMANPLGTAIANANLELLLSRDWHADVKRIEAGLQSGLAGASSLPNVADVRVLGAIGVVELRAPVDISAATQAALAEGVWLRPFRDLIYTMPPYITDDDDVATITRGVIAAARACA